MKRRCGWARRQSALRVVIAGGGTGGHLYPGIAVARELLSAAAGRAGLVCRDGARASKRASCRAKGFALDLHAQRRPQGQVARWSRARGAALLPAQPASMPGASSSARRPHLVIGVGGYSSGPVVLVAALRGVPTMLLEQNAVPGLTNRLLAPFVRAAAVTFESTRAFFGAKAFVSGNPVRPEFLRGGRADRSRARMTMQPASGS